MTKTSSHWLVSNHFNFTYPKMLPAVICRIVPAHVLRYTVSHPNFLPLYFALWKALVECVYIYVNHTRHPRFFYQYEMLCARWVGASRIVICNIQNNVSNYAIYAFERKSKLLTEKNGICMAVCQLFKPFRTTKHCFPHLENASSHHS